MKRLVRKAESRVVYHGTTFQNAKVILQDGLIKPRNESGNVNGFMETSTLQDDAVYLASDSMTATEYGGDQPVVFEVNIDTENDNIRVDEDSVREDVFLKKFLELCEQKNVDASKYENMDPYDFIDFDHLIEIKQDKVFGPIIVEVVKNFDIKDSWYTSNITFIGSIPLSKVNKMIVGYEELETATLTLEELERLANELGWREE